MSFHVPSLVVRDTTSCRINAVVNHPEVRPWVAEGVAPIDLSPQVANPRNILLMGEHGGVMFLHVTDGVYESHTQVLPEARGEWTRALTDACARYMFTRTDAYEITTRVPAGHIAAAAAARCTGMRHEFTRPGGMLFKGERVDAHIYSGRIQDWVARTEELEATGEWLHRRMHEEAQRIGIDVPKHEDDANHNRYVGAAVEMAFGGQYLKAILTYNRWVSLARQTRDGVLQHVSLVSRAPPVIRFDIGLMRFHADDIEVMREC